MDNPVTDNIIIQAVIPEHKRSTTKINKRPKKTKKNNYYKRLLLLLLILLCLILLYDIMYDPPVITQNFHKHLDYPKAFKKIYHDIYNKKNRYISEEGMPYHGAEKLIIEAVDYGKISTSEAMSLKVWMDVMQAGISRNWNAINKDWELIEKYYIPSQAEQPNIQAYNPNSPALYIANPSNQHLYPQGPGPIRVGKDPIGKELAVKYGDSVYLMHWYIDVDNWFRFDHHRAVKADLFARGPQESTWETIPHPSYDKDGASPRGLVNLFIKTQEGQWRYTAAPDAELRIIQAMFWADRFAKKQKKSISHLQNKALKMGNFTRYVLYDKFFHRIGEGKQAGNGKESAHYLVSWMAGWGGGTDGFWSWRIGYHQVHSGYQNPLAAWYLAQKGVRDWGISRTRQLEMITWVQSKEGAIGGGVLNDYSKPNGPFYGLQYMPHPSFLDPPSNNWGGWQYFLMDRVAEYYYVTGDERAYKILDKWMKWMVPNIKFVYDYIFIPTELRWSGAPHHHNLSCRIKTFGYDTGNVACLANTLMFWDKANLKWKQQQVDTMPIALKLLDMSWKTYYDGKGITVAEQRPDYSRFWSQKITMPEHTTKIMPWGKKITNNKVFKDFRPDYGEKLPPKGPYNPHNPAPSYRYHRTWAQCQFAIALAYAEMFQKGLI